MAISFSELLRNLFECAGMEDDDCACSEEIELSEDEIGRLYYDEFDENTGETYRVYVEDSDISEDEEGYYEDDQLDEAAVKGRRIIYRVNFRGRKVRKIKCGPGRVVKRIGDRVQCVVPTGGQRLRKRLAIRKANRTKKRKGAAFQRRVQRKRLRALRFRKTQGLKNQK